MKDLKQFNTELKQKNLAGYWETAEAETYRQPASSFRPCLWKSKDIHDAITGHSSGGGVGRTYGGAYPLKPLAAAMKKLRHRGLDLSNLRSRGSAGIAR